MGILLNDGKECTEQVGIRPAIRASDVATTLRLTLAGAGTSRASSPPVTSKRACSSGFADRGPPRAGHRGR
ncbi:hypothetical protein [Methylobacterium sp. CM6244]